MPCPAIAPLPLSQPKKKKPPMKLKEKIGMGQQVMEFSPQSSEEEGTLTPNKLTPVFYESNSERDNDPMVSGTIISIELGV